MPPAPGRGPLLDVWSPSPRTRADGTSKTLRDLLEPALPLAECLDSLVRDHGLSDVQAVRCIERWARQGRVRNVRGGLEPRRLSRRAAVAHVLCDKPAGMARADVERAVNAKGLRGERRPGDGGRPRSWASPDDLVANRPLRFQSTGRAWSHRSHYAPASPALARRPPCSSP